MADADQANVLEVVRTPVEVVGAEAALDDAQKVRLHTKSIFQLGQSRSVAWGPLKRRGGLHWPHFEEQSSFWSSVNLRQGLHQQQMQA